MEQGHSEGQHNELIVEVDGLNSAKSILSLVRSQPKGQQNKRWKITNEKKCNLAKTRKKNKLPTHNITSFEGFHKATNLERKKVAEATPENVTSSQELSKPNKGKRVIAKDHSGGHGTSLAQSTREHSVDRPSTSQFVTTEQLGDALKQVQEGVMYGVYKKMKAVECQLELIQGFEYEPTAGYTPMYQQARSQHPQRDANPLQGGDVRRIIKAKQAM
ncbi:hypothetical protein Cgig2_002751 [Carnegiea gigantea]|uniref:Uncharacterized protein n=1 Tax=Carnegiea gigantea TaxID=171969 RepID=A0A9Q1GYC7_9CARY|nr:hypothetical protein Cgig2_002751 [Carnegiea gigantea]